MTSTPYPVFLSSSPTSRGKALAAVGRCRIYPTKCCSSSPDDEYKQILSKCVEQTKLDDPKKTKNSESKKLHKKLMKQSVALAQSYLQQTLQLDTTIIDVEVVIENPHDITETDGCIATCFLDAGASSIVINGSCLKAMDDAKIPRERLVAHFDVDNNHQSLFSFSSSTSALSSNDDGDDGTTVALVDALRNASQLAHVISVDMSMIGRQRSSSSNSSSGGGDCGGDGDDDPPPVIVGDILHLLKILDDANKTSSTTDDNDVSLVVQLSPLSSDNDNDDGDDVENTTVVQELSKLIGTIATETKNKCTVAITDPTPSQLGYSLTSCLKTDRHDGLYTTVVCTRSNEALGLVYSSKESIVAALQCGKGVYYSRSRNGLWRKGDTSGHYQILHRIDVDCDGDALRFTVTQMASSASASSSSGGDDGDEGGESTQLLPAFCHLNTLTCWGKPRGIRHLEEVLTQRLHDAPPGSYTKRLFDDEYLLRDKLVEEAQELSEANTKIHVAEELADVIYFAMVKAAKVGVSIDDAVMELDRRSRKVTRRQGDSKDFRIKAGEAILKKKEEEEK